MSASVTLTDFSSVNPQVIRLRENLNTCSTYILSDNVEKSQESVNSLVEFLDSFYNLNLIESEEDDNTVPNQIRINSINPEEDENVQVLHDLLRFLTSSSLNQMVVDVLALRLPGVVAKLGCVSDKCREISECLIDRLVSTCNPRDMLSILCEALDPPIEMFETPAYFLPLLSGLSKVFVLIKRRHLEQIREAIPIVLNVVKSVSSNSYDGDKDVVEHLIGLAVNIGTSIQEVCQKLEDRRKKELRAILGLYVLQIMVFASLVDRGLSCIPMVSQLSSFFPFCNLSYSGLITGCEVESLSSIFLKDGDYDYISWFPLVRHGAALAVIWGYISDDIAKAAKQDLSITLMVEFRSSQIKRWQIVDMLKYVLSSVDLPWNLKRHAIELLLCIIDESNSEKCSEFADCSIYIPSLFAALQAIINVIIYAPDVVLRKNAFAALKRVLSDIPSYQRFDILKALITSSTSSSMIAILIDLIKGEMLMVNLHKRSTRSDAVIQEKVLLKSPFWSSNILDLVEFVLKPPKGGLPLIPQQSDEILSALNLYRYVLLAESKGKTNHTGVLSESTLKKAYKEWLLPLQTLITGVTRERGCSELEVEMACGFNPIEMVLYRCIELVEEKLQDPA